MIFPPGDYSIPIVGDQWVFDQDLMILSHGKANRGIIKTGFSNFADTLRNAQTGPLADQRGHTADDLRSAYRQGEEQAREVAEKNGVKENAYGTAYESIVSLQHDLTNIAEEANNRITEIQDSKLPMEAKVTQIVATVHQYRAQASMVAAKYSGNIFDAMQRILDTEGTGQSARQFAQANGVNVGQMFRPPEDEKNLEQYVRGNLGHNGAQAGATPGFATPRPGATPQPGGTPGFATPHPGGTPDFATPQPGAAPPVGGQTAPAGVATGASTSFHSAAGKPPPSAEGQAVPGAPGSRTNLTSAFKSPSPPAPTDARLPSPSIFPSAPSASAPAPLAPPNPGVHAGVPSTAATPGTPLTGAPIAPASPVQPVTPADLMHSFDKGMQAGTPISATAGAMPPPQASEPQAPPTTPTSGMGSVAANAPAYEAPPVAHATAPDATPAPQVVAGPSAPAAPAASAPSGPLPAYASDMRPAAPAASAPVVPSSAPPSAMASSAPVHPSAGQASPAGPTMVRQTPTPPPPSSPSSLGTEAVAATATGAVAGAASANAAERARLERLVASVARQQPRLAWAAGDRDDETTVLTTDLASGWIPPGIELPAAVTLLSPERRRGDIETLLGEVTLAAGYTPIHHVPEEDEPVPSSSRPRRLPEIDELGWELNQATQWRDGLPRLAHTLAKAATSGTGVLDKEVELLQTHLKEVSTRVLDSYPDNVDFHDVGNWQLLAAIEALVAGDKSEANYHLAWFQACSASISK